MDFLFHQLFFTLRNVALGILLPVSFFLTQAHANDADPFQMDRTEWMSFDRYKDDVKHGKTYEPVPVAKPETPTTKDTHYLNGATDDSDSPVVAAPQRPVNPPPLPGVNKGFDIQVGSTDDDKQPVAQITHMDSDPTMQLKKNWETTKEAMRRLQNKKPGSEDDENSPLDVRMSFLPSNSVIPIPDPATPHSTEGRPPLASVAASQLKKEDPNAAEYAKWSAELDAYKKRQLEAIQSDRATLSALQDAIHQLGLEKQLDFMPGSKNSLSPQADSVAPIAPPSGPAPSLGDLSKKN